MKKRFLITGALLVALAFSLTIASAFGAGGRLQLYLVNAGPGTTFYHASMASDGDCDRFDNKPASLSTTRGSAVQIDSPGYAFTANAHPSVFSYTVSAGGGFTVPASDDAVLLKMWAYSGDATCGGQDGDQTVDWKVTCSGATCGSNVSLTGAGQASKPGWQSFPIPAGTAINSLSNAHAGPGAPVTVGPGDVISLQLSADTWSVIQWSAPTGNGASSLSIAQR